MVKLANAHPVHVPGLEKLFAVQNSGLPRTAGKLGVDPLRRPQLAQGYGWGLEGQANII